MYFRATGGSGGAGATLTVTYSEDFYGLTITATNGTRTLTKVATSSGSVVFRLPADGTWTVSATVEGQTYSESVLVDTAYSTELSALPTGSTATPVNVIKTWLRCAQITDKAYTTLSQVLNDTATLEALVSDSNACDYMARSTNWASGIAADANAMKLIGKFDYCANKLLSNSTWMTAIANSDYFESVLNVKVPTMTSNTTPSGIASASSVYQSGYEAYKIFDNNNSTDWISIGNPQGTTWVQYEFTMPVKVAKLKMRNAHTASVIIRSGYNTCTVKASNDGTTFTTINTFTFSQTTVDGEGTYNVNNSTAYKYWRVEVPITPSVGQVGMSGLQFYGRAESTMIPLVPKMTSNTTPSGVVSRSSVVDNTGTFESWKAFDGNDSTYWIALDVVSAIVDYGDWIQYQFTEPTIVNKLSFIVGASYTVTKKYKIQGSNNGTDWTDLYNGTYTLNGSTSPSVHDKKTINANFNNSIAYTYYRVRYDSLYAHGVPYSINIYTIQFYCRAETATQVLFHSAAQDDLYYMDNGSPVIIAHTDDFGYAIVDRELLPEGVNLTIYSTVAKDPSSLGSPYSRVIHFSKYLTDVYLRPFGTLYWYGYFSDNCEDITSANGWTGYSTLIAPDHNTNSISKENVNYNSGIGSKTPVSAISAYCIGYGVGDNTSMTNASSKALSSYIKTQRLNGTATPALASITGLTGNTYINVWGNLGSGRNIFVNALWYE